MALLPDNNETMSKYRVGNYFISPSKEDHYKSIISTLPEHNGTKFPKRLYQNFWFLEIHLLGLLNAQETFKPRPTDIILATMPKSGTTWLKALAFAIANRSKYSFDQHPLLSLNPHLCVPFLEISINQNVVEVDIETLPSPRILSTHLPYSMLPALASSECRVVYLCRDPRDVFVSTFFFKREKHLDRINYFFELFCQGISMFGPVWDHNLEYWKESLARPEKVLFLKYEEMMSDPIAYATKLAEFMGYPFTEEEIENGVVNEVVRLCSFKSLSSIATSKNVAANIDETLPLKFSEFFRNGQVGDWRNHLSREMDERLSRVYEEKVKGSGLNFEFH